MPQLNASQNSLTLGLAIGWGVFAAVTIVIAAVRGIRSIRRYGPGSAAARAIWRESVPLPVILLHVIWLTIILIASSANWVTVACFWLFIVLLFIPAYASFRISYRRLRRLEDAKLQRDAQPGHSTRTDSRS